MKKNKTLIVGYGEIGSSLCEVLETVYDVEVHDPAKNNLALMEKYDVMHICFPPSKNFVKLVKHYQKTFKPTYTVIHSTVPVGTSRMLKAYHSPVRGVHPNIAEGIKTFVKYLAPKSEYLTKYFKKAGINIHQVDDSRTTESLKIWDTTYYGWNIAFEKLLHEWCKENKIDYNIVYSHANNSYNEGYKKLGRPEVVRPVLKHMDGGIGGHCVINNLALFKSPIGEFIKKHNERFKMPKVRKGSSKS